MVDRELAATASARLEAIDGVVVSLLADRCPADALRALRESVENEYGRCPTALARARLRGLLVRAAALAPWGAMEASTALR